MEGTAYGPSCDWAFQVTRTPRPVDEVEFTPPSEEPIQVTVDDFVRLCIYAKDSSGTELLSGRTTFAVCLYRFKEDSPEYADARFPFPML